MKLNILKGMGHSYLALLGILSGAAVPAYAFDGTSDFGTSCTIIIIGAAISLLLLTMVGWYSFHLKKANRLLAESQGRERETVRKSSGLQEMLEKITKFSEEAVIVFDELGRIKHSNLAAENIFHVKQSELHKLNIRDLFDPQQDSDHFFSLIDQREYTLLDSDNSDTFDLIVRRDDERKLFLKLTLSTVVVDGANLGLAVIRDQSAITESKDRLAELLKNIYSGVSIYQATEKGNDFILIDINLQGEKISKLKRNDAIGKKFSELFPQVGANGLLNVLQEVYRTGVTRSVPNLHYSDLRIDIWVKNQIYKLSGGEVVIIYDDITDARRATEELRRSEERYALAARGANDGLWDWDILNDKVYFSPRWKKLIGYEDHEIKNVLEEWDGRIHPDDQIPVWEDLNNCLEGKSSTIAQKFRMLHKDGSYRWIMARAYLSRDETGRPVRMSGSHSDITETVTSNEALIESEKKFRSISSSAKDGILMMDNEGRLTFWNEAAEKIFGYATDEVIGKDLHRVIAPERFYQAYKFGFEKFRQSGQGMAVGKTIELMALKKDGAEFPVELSISSVQFEGAWHAVGILRDISQRKIVEQALSDSESFVRGIISSVNEGVIVYDADLRYKIWNKFMEELTGETAEELIGQDAFEAHPFLIEYGLKDSAERALAGEIVKNDDKLFTMLNTGEQRWLSITNTPHRDAGGNIVGVVTSINDVTKRKMDEKKIRDADRFKKQILDTAATALYTVDSNQNITSVNRAFTEITGYTEAEAVGSKCLKLKGDCCNESCPFIRGERGNEIKNARCTIDTKDGQRLIIQKNANLMLNEEGEITGAIGSFIDITELLATQEKAEAANLAKSQFLANMSHEIRTPLNGVIGMNGLLLDTELDGIQRDYVKAAISSADSLMTVINDILDHSKIEAHKMDIEKHEFDLELLVDEVVNATAIRAHEKALELICALDKNVPPTLVGDSNRIKQVLINLVGNAIKFTEQGEVAVNVSLQKIKGDNASVRFEVRDTGIGIPPDRIDLLFKSFSQVDASTTRKFGGTGLGLSISKNLVEMMGGTIEVSSEPEQGSVFRFSVPLKTSATRAKVIDIASSRIVGRRILVVDDNGTNRRILETQLNHLGCKVTLTSSGITAIKLIEKAHQNGKPYELALIDLAMPGMDGESLGRLVKNNPALASTKLVLMTSLGRWGGDFGLKDIFDASLAKPIKRAKLDKCLREVFNAEIIEEKSVETVAVDAVNAEPQEQFNRASLKILLAEDNKVNRKVAIASLGKVGYHIDAVENGEQAVEILEKENYDLVLMDVQMPVMDGFEATAAIREKEKQTGERMPIVAMTAHAMKGDRERCLDAGMDDYVTKPIDVKKIDEVIINLMSRLPKKQAEGEEMLIIDERHLLERLGGDCDLAREIIELYIEDMPELICEMRKGIDIADAQAISNSAHGIKGASANIGAEVIRNVALQIENAGKDGDLFLAGELMPRLEGEFEKFCEVKKTQMLFTEVSA